MSNPNFTSRSIESRRANNPRFQEKYSRNSQAPRNFQKPKNFNLLPIVVGIIIALLLPVWYAKSTAGIMIPAGKYQIETGDTASVLNEKLKLGIADWRYRMYVRLF